MKILKRHPLAGLFLGVALVAIGLLSLPFASESADAASAPVANQNCPMTRVVLDDGYGLTRTAVQRVCP